ncbi:hypothetical protein MTO96_019816 [Rhipicephalus appendiculatus]
MLAECTSITKLTLGGVRDEYVNISEATMTRCAEALAQNDTLEELKLSYSLWHPNNWIAFFAVLPMNKQLKKLEVFNHDVKDYETFLPVLKALAQTNSSGRVSFGAYTHETDALVDLIHVREFSSICIFLWQSVDAYALERLPALDHFTCLSLVLFEPDPGLFSALGKYIRVTTVLRELRLSVSCAATAVPSLCWALFFESISANTTIASLRHRYHGRFDAY